MNHRRSVSLVALILMVIFSLMQSSTVRRSTTTLNIEWYFFLSSLFFFGVAGYAVKLAIEGRLKVYRAKRRKRNIFAYAITFLALIVAVYLIFFHRDVDSPVEVEGANGLLEKLRPNVTFGDLVVVWKQFPGWVYLIPPLLFLIIVLTAKRIKRRQRSVPGIRFEPKLTYDSIDGTPPEKVIKMYKNVVAGLISKGYPYQKSWTHWEHEEKLKEIFPDLEDLDTLTRIFEKAKYAGRLDDSDVKLARESYERLMSFLR